MVATQLDVSKAFDTLPHQSIGDALHRKGVPEFLVNTILVSYKNIRTTIKQGSVEIPMELKRGVKQGDPAISIHIQHHDETTSARTRKDGWLRHRQ
jgi:hypothetical protein